MNPKIAKLRTEFEKNKNKISDLQGRNRELEKQIRELEDTDIIGMVLRASCRAGRRRLRCCPLPGRFHRKPPAHSRWLW